MNIPANVALVESEYGIAFLDKRRGSYWQLNETGALVLGLLLDGRNVEDVTRKLVQQYAIGEADAASDIRKLINQLINHGLLMP